MLNPIYKSGLFNTPTMEELQQEIEGLPASERAIAYHYTLMTMNMCHQLVENALEAEKAVAAIIESEL